MMSLSLLFPTPTLRVVLVLVRLAGFLLSVIGDDVMCLPLARRTLSPLATQDSFGVATIIVLTDGWI